MPTYTYNCPKCGKIIEQFLSIREFNDFEIKCSECEENMKSIINAPHFAMFGFLANGPPEHLLKNDNGGIITKQPIIKDRKTGRTLYGPNIPV